MQEAEGMLRNRGVRLMLLAVVVSTSACVPWKTVSLAPRPEPAAFVGAEVRLVRTDGSTLILRDVRLEGDSVVSVSKGVTGSRPASTPTSPPVRTAIALSDVRTMEVRSLQEVKSRSYVMMALALTALVFAIDAYNDCWVCHY